MNAESVQVVDSPLVSAGIEQDQFHTDSLRLPHKAISSLSEESDDRAM